MRFLMYAALAILIVLTLSSVVDISRNNFNTKEISDNLRLCYFYEFNTFNIENIKNSSESFGLGDSVLFIGQKNKIFYFLIKSKNKNHFNGWYSLDLNTEAMKNLDFNSLSKVEFEKSYNVTLYDSVAFFKQLPRKIKK